MSSFFTNCVETQKTYEANKRITEYDVIQGGLIKYIISPCISVFETLSLLFSSPCNIFSSLELSKRFIRSITLAYLYPAAHTMVNEKINDPNKSSHAILRMPWEKAEKIESLTSQGWTVEEGLLRKNGRTYKYYYAKHPDNKSNQIAVFAPGSTTCALDSLSVMGRSAQQLRFNFLIADSPLVDENDGDLTSDTLGEAQDLAISFAESLVLENKKEHPEEHPKVLVIGHSIGGATTSEGVLQHEQFLTEIDYQFVFYKTLESVSKIAAQILPGAPTLIEFAGLGLNCVSAVERLQNEGIPVVIVNSKKDRMIAYDESLAHAFVQGGKKDSTGFCIVNTNDNHNRFHLPEQEIQHNFTDAIQKTWRDQIQKKLKAKSSLSYLKEKKKVCEQYMKTSTDPQRWKILLDDVNSKIQQAEKILGENHQNNRI